MDENQRAELLSLSRLFAALSEVFLDPGSGVSVRLRAVEASLPQPVSKGVRALLSAPAQPEELGPEYVRLFMHGTRSPTVHPYESVYRYGRLMAPEVLTDLKRVQSEAGIRPRAGVHIPPDHLALELELLAYLLDRAASEPDRGRWLALAHSLLADHLLPFSEAFCVRLEGSEPHPYYHRAGELLVAGLASCDAYCRSASAARHSQPPPAT